MSLRASSLSRSTEQKLETLSPFEVKNTLISLAQSDHHHAMINAGRGNPNWVTTTPRHAFFQLGLFALAESERTFGEVKDFGGICGTDGGVADRFHEWAKANAAVPGVSMLVDAVTFCKNELGIDPESLLIEWVDGILGDNYPVPDRMLVHSETIVEKFLSREMGAGLEGPPPKFDVFAVEGGTAAMVYIFNTLKSNGFLNPGDTIAIGTPIFTPYIEMPELEDYQLEKVEVNAVESNGWQIPDEELAKLKDPKIKAFFLVNPSNPPSVRMNDKTLKSIAALTKERPDLILLTDDVYGTFTENFTSLAMIAPRNTILVYSFSKYFGATGWRLGTICVAKDNQFDVNLANRNEAEKERLHNRYKGITLDVPSLRFIDRIVADSRAVALNHTAGLSTPQQIQMSLFSLFCLLDKDDVYKGNCKSIVRTRYAALFSDTPHKPIIKLDDPTGAFYYVELDIKLDAENDYGKEFCAWLEENFEPLDFCVRLAKNYGVIAMDGTGFDSPAWTVRLSLANLHSEDYKAIRKAVDALLKVYYAKYEGREEE